MKCVKHDAAGKYMMDGVAAFHQNVFKVLPAIFLTLLTSIKRLPLESMYQ
jgi:hypothetical protein